MAIGNHFWINVKQRASSFLWMGRAGPFYELNFICIDFTVYFASRLLIVDKFNGLISDMIDFEDQIFDEPLIVQVHTWRRHF